MGRCHQKGGFCVGGGSLLSLKLTLKLDRPCPRGTLLIGGEGFHEGNQKTCPVKRKPILAGPRHLTPPKRSEGSPNRKIGRKILRRKRKISYPLTGYLNVVRGRRGSGEGKKWRKLSGRALDGERRAGTLPAAAG